MHHRRGNNHVVQIGVGPGDGVRVPAHGVLGAGQLPLQFFDLLPGRRVFRLEPFQFRLHFGVGVGTLQPGFFGFPEIGGQLVHLLAQIGMTLLRRFQLRGQFLMGLSRRFQLLLRGLQRPFILLDGLLLQLEFLLQRLQLRLRPGGGVLEIGNAGRRQFELGVSLLQLLVYGTQVCREIIAIEG